MDDIGKTKEQLLAELSALRRQVTTLQHQLFPVIDLDRGPSGSSTSASVSA